MDIPPPYPFCERWPFSGKVNTQPQVFRRTDRNTVSQSVSCANQNQEDLAQPCDSGIKPLVSSETSLADSCPETASRNGLSKKSIRDLWYSEPETVAQLVMDENVGFGVYADEFGNEYEMEMTPEWRRRVKEMIEKREKRKKSKSNENRKSRRANRSRRSHLYMVEKCKTGVNDVKQQNKKLIPTDYNPSEVKIIHSEEAWLNAHFDKACDEDNPVLWPCH
mmetsp:Transcript_14883/g.16832  ORF Transcript_14883/g.16832 Transcript_14883/m.16832 type:complete len:221 (-) Transcript_14883:77-739(-)